MWAYSFGQFRARFEEFGTKRGGRAPPPLDPRLQWSLNEDNKINLTLGLD